MIGCTSLGKRFGSRWLFRGLNFEVVPGDCLVVLGRNGSGKSTLLKILAGLASCSEGSVARPMECTKSLGYAALDQSVYPMLTVEEHLELAGELRGCASRAEDLLKQVGLWEARDRFGRALSTGMRARLKFALAVQARPEVLLFDEPGAGLDEDGRAMLAELIQEYRTGCSLILATNDPLERRFATLELDLD